MEVRGKGETHPRHCTPYSAMIVANPTDGGSDADSSGIESKKNAVELHLPSSAWNGITHTVDLWSQFKYLTKLDLNNNGLSTLPSCLEVLPLEILFLSENNFDAFPECIGKMRKLRMLSLRGNRLTELSSTNLPTQTLVWLILTNNRICNIDTNVKELKHVRKLMLSHNKLTSIPKEMGECTNLELIRLANNDINVPLPIEFLTLPKLAWISLAGNPIAHCPQSTKKHIMKYSVSVDESTILGQGASGTVYKGQYNGEDVAVKIFKKESTGSDGTAADEAAINSLIEHPLVVSAHGVFLSEDNSCPEGMVMELLDGADALGKPPSFNSVTRDAGPTEIGKDLTREQVLCVVWNVVAALEHVHSTTKVANGDIYLHNVLKCGDCIAKVSDWGASFVYDCIVDSPPQIFESIEVLAFGRLVQDLFDWHLDTALPDATESAECIGKSRGMPLEAGPFYDLMNSILQPIQAERPSFSDIKAVLKSIPEFEAATNAPE